MYTTENPASLTHFKNPLVLPFCVSCWYWWPINRHSNLNLRLSSSPADAHRAISSEAARNAQTPSGVATICVLFPVTELRKSDDEGRFDRGCVCHMTGPDGCVTVQILPGSSLPEASRHAPPPCTRTFVMIPSSSMSNVPPSSCVRGRSNRSAQISATVSTTFMRIFFFYVCRIKKHTLPPTHTKTHTQQHKNG